MYMNKTTCLQVSYIPPLPFLCCNPSTLQPLYHCPSPCKLSWSEPQRPLLSVDLRLLTFFHLPNSVLRLLHPSQSFALLHFEFWFQRLPSFFPALRHSNLGITAHPLATCLGLNPNKLSCLQASYIPPLSFIFCNPSTLQSRYHCSSPCKLSWSEPQRPLLSADLRFLTFLPSA